MQLFKKIFLKEGSKLNILFVKKWKTCLKTIVMERKGKQIQLKSIIRIKITRQTKGKKSVRRKISCINRSI